MKKIAILGSTGYIGKSLSYEFLKDGGFELYLFYRSNKKKNDLTKRLPKGNSFKFCTLDKFNKFNYDVIINVSGIGELYKIKENLIEIFKVTEEIDNLVINYLEKHKNSIYINLSSGAVYGNDYKKSVNSNSKTVLDIGKLDHSMCYSIAKINSEAKHRSMEKLNIVDLRVFSFFSQFVDENSKFLMSEIVNCLKNKKVFKTNDVDIVRDYVTPEDLYNLIKLIIKNKKINDYFDVYSKKPVSKLELLSFLKDKYDLKISIKKELSKKNKVQRNVYYSKDKKAKKIGYEPKFNSKQGIGLEIDKMHSSGLL